MKAQIAAAQSQPTAADVVDALWHAQGAGTAGEVAEITRLTALAADAEEAERILAAGGVAFLVARVSSGDDADASAVAAALRALWTLAEHPPLRAPLARLGAVTALVAVLAATGDDERAWAAAGALCALARSQAQREAALAAGVLRPLLALLDGTPDRDGPTAMAVEVQRLAAETLLPGRG